MGNTLNQVKREVSVAAIVRHGEKVIIPSTMALESAVDLLLRRMEFEEQEIELHETYDVFPFDGANALNEVLIGKFGWSPAVPIPGFFFDEPPQLISVEVAYGVKKQIPFGRFQLYGSDKGFVQCGHASEGGRVCFQITASVKRKDEPMVREIFEGVRNYLKNGGSIYQGKALKLRFRDEAGKALQLPAITFVDVSGIDPAGLIYSRSTMNAIHTNLFTPILRVKELMANNLPIKRTIMLGGIYGTGKTLAAGVASKHATDSGVTYLYIPRADELADALKFAKQYSDPACVVFCEDIDRVMKGERSVKMDDLLNIIDGVDTKSARIITVLTTNHLTALNPAMLRPGRLDAVIEVGPPDAEAVEKLIRLYGGELIDQSMSLKRIGDRLSGHIPATIAEVVKRAKLSQLKLNRTGQLVEELTEDALLDSADSMAVQLELLRVKSKETVIEPTINDMVRKEIHTVLTDGGGTTLVEKCVGEMERRFGFKRVLKEGVKA